jgi:predicted ribosomally synthesized peptide with nif11-like leader
MSKQAFINFCTKAAESDDLAKKIEAAQTPADIVALGAESGFVFSEADAKEGSQELSEQGERELSEGELTSVSGGLSLNKIVDWIRRIIPRPIPTPRPPFGRF